jgi:hypothetical protein
MENTSVAVKARVKDEQAVYSHYNDTWTSLRDTISVALNKEGPNLARVRNRALEVRGQGARKQRGRFLPHICGETLSDRVGRNCHLAYYNAVVLDAIRSRLPETVQRIVEMGSGWGAIISSLWLSGAPKDAEYWALEYTQSGREATALIASTEPRFRLKACAFDYHHPDFSQMVEPMETVVYSVYSIERVTTVKDALIENILAIPGFSRCVHIEPVGWQVNPHTLSARIDRLARTLGLPPLTQAAASARHCWRHGKNCNLIETLRRYERSGRIVIETIVKDLVANDPLNPGTLVVWRPA